MIGAPAIDDAELCRQWPSGSYERAAIDGGLAGVKALAQRRCGDAPKIDQIALRALGRVLCVDAATDGPAGMRRWLQANLPEIDSDTTAQMAVAKLGILPMLALCLKSNRALPVDDLLSALPPLCDRLERLRQVTSKVPVKAELLRYADAVARQRPRRGPKANPRLSAKSRAILECELDGMFMPPAADVLVAIVDRALSGDVARPVGSEIERLRKLAIGDADSIAILTACEGLSAAARRALDRARGLLMHDHDGDGRFLWQMTNETSALLASRAAARRAGHGDRREWQDTTAGRLLDLHQKLKGFRQWDIRITGNRTSGGGAGFARLAFQLYRLPLATSADWVSRARRQKLASNL